MNVDGILTKCVLSFEKMILVYSQREKMMHSLFVTSSFLFFMFVFLLGLFRLLCTSFV